MTDNRKEVVPDRPSLGQHNSAPPPTTHAAGAAPVLTEAERIAMRFIPDIVWEVRDEYEARRGSRVEDRSAKREELAVAINNLCRLARAKQCREDAGVVEAKSQGEVRGIIVDPSVPLPDRQKWFADQQTHRIANEVSTALLLDAAATIRARAAKLEKLP